MKRCLSAKNEAFRARSEPDKRARNDRRCLDDIADLVDARFIVVVRVRSYLPPATARTAKLEGDAMLYRLGDGTLIASLPFAAEADRPAYGSGKTPLDAESDGTASQTRALRAASFDALRSVLGTITEVRDLRH